VADPRYDPAIFAGKAAEARQLADSARVAFRDDIVERGARLGIQRDELAAEIHAKREQAQAAEQQAKRELGEAERLDRAADALERRLIKPDSSARGLGEHIRDEELSEQVAEQRALADAARARATAADTRADALETESIRMRDDLFGVERQLASEPARRKAIEEQLDRLDESATHFADLSRNATRIAEQERIASDAELRGDQALVDRANQLIRTSQDAIDWGVKRQLPEPDGAVLLQIGVTVPADFTSPPVAMAEPSGGDADAGSGEALAAADPSAVDPDLIELGDPAGADATATAAAATTDEAGTDADVDVLTGLPTASTTAAAATPADDQSTADQTGGFDDGGFGSADFTANTEDVTQGFGEFVAPDPAIADADAFAAIDQQPQEPSFSEFVEPDAFGSDATFAEPEPDASASPDTGSSFGDEFG
jgi:hypothetical protein